MGRFETYSKRKFKVSMVLFACISWPWKAALTKTLQKPNLLPESIFPSHPQWEFIPALISISYSAVAPNTAQVSGGPLGGTSAGHGVLWLSWSGCTGWSCDTCPCAGERCWGRRVSAEYLHMDIVQLLLAQKAVGRQAAAQGQRVAEQQPQPSSHSWLKWQWQ